MGAASPLEGVTATLRGNCLSLTQCDEYNIEEWVTEDRMRVATNRLSLGGAHVSLNT